MAGKRAEEPSFDSTLSELECIVQKMEQGDLPLEEALKQFEQGIALVRLAQQRVHLLHIQHVRQALPFLGHLHQAGYVSLDVALVVAEAAEHLHRDQPAGD